MNVLVLGNSDSVFIRDFATYVLNRESINTVILTPALSENYKKDYVLHHIREVKWPAPFLTAISERKDVIALRIKALKELKQEIGFGDNIDVLHMHLVEPMHLLYFFSFWKKAKKKVLTFWGSDILRVSGNKTKLFPYFLKHATSIVFMIQNQCDFFHTIFGHKYDGKIHIIDFGNSLLDVIDLVEEKYSIIECKQHFGLSKDKYIVHIGYNAFKGQQHIKILKSMRLIPSELLQKMQLVFHVSYGQEDDFADYKSQMIEIMQESKIDFVFFDDYLQSEELAKFRRTCDIFIYGQKTDARSASPLEYIYAGAKFICPGWLADNYELLDEAGIRYYIYDDFAYLPNVLENCVKEMNMSTERISAKSKKRIHDEISWDSLAEKWRRLYE